MKKILTLFLACYSLVIILLLAVITEPQRVNAGLTSFGLPGIYNQTPLSLTNGDGAALALDYQGRVILSTSTVINASFGNLLPSSNNTYDIGAWGSAWRDVYASGTLRASSTIIAKTGSTLNGGVAGLYLDNDQNAANSLFGIQFQNVGNAGIGKALIVGRTDAADTTNGLSFFVGSNGAMTESLRIDGVTTNVFPGGNNTIDLGAYGNAWKDFYASGTIYGVTTTSTITLTGSYNPATGTRSNLKDYVMPFDCTIGEIIMNATSTFGVFPTVIDVNKQTSMGVGTTTLFTTQTSRPQLGNGGLTTSTVPQVKALTKGNILNFDIDQFGNQGGLDIQVICAKPLSH